MKYVKVFQRDILGTAPEAYITLANVFVCHIPTSTHALLRGNKEFSHPRVYISTKSMKHGYDKRPTFTEDNIDEVCKALKDPDIIARNEIWKDGRMVEKRGDFIFFRRLGRRAKFLGCPIEVIEHNGDGVLFCVSFFPSDENYIAKFPTLWDREGGENPPS